MTTWTNLNDKFITLLKDTTGVSYPEPLRILSWNMAQVHFAVGHTARLVKAVAAQAGSDYTLPADMIVLAGLKIGTAWLEPDMFVPGEQDDDISGYIQTHDKIYFPTSTDALTVWYYGLYTDVTTGSDVITTPKWAEAGLINLALSFMLCPDAIARAKLGSFQQRQDGGQPEDNPMRRQAQYHLDLYRTHMSGVKAQDREVLFKVGR